MYFLGLLLALIIAVLGELVSDEVRARLDRLPLVLLSAAARRLSSEQRNELYERAWLPELHHILRGEQATPITRLIHGMRYAVRLWLAAPQIMRELEPDRAPATRSGRMLQFVFAPIYVVVYSMTRLPIAAASTTYAIRHPSWICGLAAACCIAMICAFALFGRKRLIQVGGERLLGREVFCSCRFSKACRSLTIIANAVATSTVTILAFKVTSLSAHPLSYSVVAIGCFFVPMWLQRRGFVAPPDAENGDAQAPA